LLLGLTAVPFAACGPDHRPEEPCEGPSFNLVVRTDLGVPLPPDTRINVRYGGNPDGEPYALGEARTPQAVSCRETSGGAPSGDDESASGDGGAAAGSVGSAPEPEGVAVLALKCGLYTQGPARLDVTAEGYEPIEDQALSFEHEKHCQVPIEVRLAPAKPDAGM